MKELRNGSQTVGAFSLARLSYDENGNVRGCPFFIWDSDGSDREMYMFRSNAIKLSDWFAAHCADPEQVSATIQFESYEITGGSVQIFCRLGGQSWPETPWLILYNNDDGSEIIWTLAYLIIDHDSMKEFVESVRSTFGLKETPEPSDQANESG